MSAGLRVLVVDDEPMMRDVLVALLEASGHVAVGPAADASAAIAIAAADRPDVVLMDVRMPGISGLEATPLLLDVSPGSRIVLLTGLPPDVIGESAIAAGAYACLPKGDAWPQIAVTLERAMAETATGKEHA